MDFSDTKNYWKGKLYSTEQFYPIVMISKFLLKFRQNFEFETKLIAKKKIYLWNIMCSDEGPSHIWNSSDYNRYLTRNKIPNILGVGPGTIKGEWGRLLDLKTNLCDDDLDFSPKHYSNTLILKGLNSQPEGAYQG